MNRMPGRDEEMKADIKARLSAILVAAGLVMGLQMAMAQPSTLSPNQISKIVASPDRSAADRSNDLRRKPEQMLDFIGIHPGIVAFDLSAAGGYTQELLARAIGPTGKVYGQSRPRDPNQASVTPAAPEGNSRPTGAVIAAPAAPHSAPRPSPV